MDSLPTELSEIITILTSPWIHQLCLVLNFIFLKSTHESRVLSCLDFSFNIRFVTFIHVLVCSVRCYFSLMYSVPIKTLEYIYPFKCWWLYRCASTRGLSWIKFPGHFLYIPLSKHRHWFLLGINTGVEVSGYCRQLCLALVDRNSFLSCLACFIKSRTMCESMVVVVQSLSHVRLFVTPWTAACQVSLSVTISWSLLKLMSIGLVW